MVDVEIQLRLAWVAVIPPDLVTRWSSETDRYIALVEQAVVMGIHEAAHFLRGRGGDARTYRTRLAPHGVFGVHSAACEWWSSMGP